MTTLWNLQIKTVRDDQDDFSIAVSPQDDTSILYSKIQQITGSTQQRLIYRGRILKETDCRIGEIVGLEDGHTIHLVRKMEATESQPPPQQPATSTSTTPSSSGFLAALLGMEERRNQRLPYRLTEEDLELPDPGSAESVRQGLMTIHTMNNDRKFYKGQWIDCRDTVNQWLEATVMDIVYPSDLLREGMVDRSAMTVASEPSKDPAVVVTDLDGRRKLLLEECDEVDAEEKIDGVCYRRRLNNDVQLLHVHYNGWPVRWDEWIRSDSERIRPFRVRTRHSGSFASPTVNSSISNSPNTRISMATSEVQDRHALLPEINRVMQGIQGMLEEVVSHTPEIEARHGDLPWDSDHGNVQTIETRSRRRELARLAPMLDRLGRVLTDAAPHVAALATSLNDEDDTEDSENEHPNSLGGLLSLLSRDRRRTNPSVSSSAAVPSVDVSASVASSTVASSTGCEQITLAEEEEELDPDYSDFNLGFVNTTRGETRQRRDEAAGMLGAYLAAASLSDDPDGLGRFLRGNAGIDIHIHAVVTSPTNASETPAATATAVTTTAPLPAAPLDDDDDGIFSELYAESPAPIGISSPSRRSRRGVLGRFFRRNSDSNNNNNNE